MHARQSRTLLAGMMAAGALAVAGVTLTACGNGSGSAQGSQASRSVTKTCQAVAAVLSDGPGPKEDPVGYAEAQMLPLGAVTVRDEALRRDIARLDRAYKQEFETNGATAAVHALATASARVDAVCPKAAP